MRTSLVILFIFLFMQLNAQYYRYNNAKCNCSGEVVNQNFNKAEIEQYFKTKLPQQRVKSLSGNVFILVYIDRNGICCSSSILNKTETDISDLKIFKLTRNFPKWKPALYNGDVFEGITPLKNEPISSYIALQLKFLNSNLQIDTTDIDSLDLRDGYSIDDDVEIENKFFKENKHKPKVFCEVYNKDNSLIPWSYSRAVSIDKQGIIWCGSDNGLLKFQNNKMTVFNYLNSPLEQDKRISEEDHETYSILCSAVDSFDNKWFSDGHNIYKFNNKNWTVYDTNNLPIKWCLHMTSNNGSVYFTNYEGVLVNENGKWSTIDSATYKLPSSYIYSVFIDSKGNKWIGTRKGNICIHDTTITYFSDSDTPLKSASINCATEDENNNIWFGLDNSDGKGGLAILSKNGTWTTYNVTNSNIPNNEISDIKIDNKRKVVWMSIFKVGIVLFDMKNWYTYTIKNSKVPTTLIWKIELDKNGDLWGATAAGLLHMKLLKK